MKYIGRVKTMSPLKLTKEGVDFGNEETNFSKGLGYGMLFLVFILPMFLFAYFVQLRLFLIVPIVLYLILFLTVLL